MNNQEKLEELKEEAEIALSILNEAKTHVEYYEIEVIEAEAVLADSEENLALWQDDLNEAQSKYDKILSSIEALESDA
jgi:chromosome segregation ATPase